jgi:environmental stress-induced protein Ves
MQFKIIRKATQQVAKWAGGTTTQLVIFPESAEYQKFNFDYRISYATVEVPESTFTFMPGVTRHLMIMKGQLEINHTDKYRKTLNKFDQDVFNGEWPTTAKGMVTDFNLMTRNNDKGYLESKIILGDFKISINQNNLFLGIYVLNGKLQIQNDYISETLEQGDFLSVPKYSEKFFNLHSPISSEIIISHVLKLN